MRRVNRSCKKEGLTREKYLKIAGEKNKEVAELVVEEIDKIKEKNRVKISTKNLDYFIKDNKNRNYNDVS